MPSVVICGTLRKLEKCALVLTVLLVPWCVEIVRGDVALVGLAPFDKVDFTLGLWWSWWSSPVGSVVLLALPG